MHEIKIFLKEYFYIFLLLLFLLVSVFNSLILEMNDLDLDVETYRAKQLTESKKGNYW